MININQFKVVIFDMDGVLIDSEPLWKIGMQRIFDSIGCNLTKKDFQKTVGLRIDEVIEYWYEVSPWEGYSVKEVETQIMSEMVKLIHENGVPLPGVVDTIRFLKEKGIKIGLATSSFTILIEAVLKTLNLTEAFGFVHSAENEAYGKPHPAVYLTVAEKLGERPLDCLVIEDSVTGIIAGKAARMTVVAIPEKIHEPNPKIILADYEFEDMTQFLNAIK
ncbi:hexitol phosphatase HxpB [Crocinitomicaceae bacterium]|jgi:mannitol-1-/sugar-/sorbitol-6-/2-deoxyglucose-6-phosphatase|nr:hexitol phosphatase HxpB [Crocinitomicaceae bacterium]